MASKDTPRVTPEYSNPPALIPRWARRAWSRLRGWLVRREEASRAYSVAMAAREEAGRIVTAERERAQSAINEAERGKRLAELESSSLQATIKERERELDLIRREKAAIEGELAVRILEVEELNEWLERYRSRLRADTAEEVAREHRAITPRGTHANNSGPS